MSHDLIDLHLHILHAVDDGPSRVEDGVEMARRLVALGYSAAYATPHQWGEMWLPGTEALSAARAQLVQALEEAGVPLSLGLGAENHLDPTFLARVQAGTFPAFDDSRVLLLELPELGEPRSLEPLLFELQTAGYRCVLAHPERHPRLLADSARVRALRDRGLLFQLCLTSLGGKQGWWTSRRAAKLVKSGFYDLASTDAHSVSDIERYVGPALKKLEKLLGAERALGLTRDAPRSLLAEARP